MKKLITLSFLLMNCLFLQAQTYKEWVRKADSCYTAKNYELSVSYYEKAFKIEQKDYRNLYDAGCSASMARQHKKAFKWLNLAIDKGYEEIAHMKKDDDLKSLYSDKDWKKMIDKFQKQRDIVEVNYDKPLQKELLDIYAEDQDIRGAAMKIIKTDGRGSKALDSIGKIMSYKDSINLIRVIKILDEKGWVGKDVVGSQASQALFLVIQHADLKYQQKYLPMMREAVKNGNANPGNLAYLEDRVALRAGGKQIYGSQVMNHPVTKKPFVSPLEDPDNVDVRRASVGLGTLSDYLKYWNTTWDVEAYKKELLELEKIIRQKKG
ncbi:hypothetical protein LPB248_09470 [Flavobacterium sp. LPB0248]|uniref:DUF6624 domain-containing protein n=1 Tax=Flavobacterium sp. LPB0248 TaxID=2614441 RepID=UPI0015A4FF4C|nr:DUF6624 domain-containing protein [Flavobacterium sp. LPB0248]QLC66507.1 hypothetical protein LPB248_09470 [Flavobacterium sp. LPB0248]